MCVIAALYNNNNVNTDQLKINIKTVKVVKEKFSSRFSVQGTVESNNKFDIIWCENIKVENVLVKEHENVKKGQQLFNFDYSDIDYQINKEKNNNEIIKLNRPVLKP